MIYRWFETRKEEGPIRPSSLLETDAMRGITFGEI